MQVETYLDTPEGDRAFAGAATMRMSVKMTGREPAITLQLMCASRNTVGFLTLSPAELAEMMTAGANALDFIKKNGGEHAQG